MSNLKGKVSLFLVMIMMMTAVLPIFAVNAASEVTMTVKMGNTTMKAGNTYEVEGGEKINVTASSAAGIAFIGYRFVKNGTNSRSYNFFSLGNRSKLFHFNFAFFICC